MLRLAALALLASASATSSLKACSSSCRRSSVNLHFKDRDFPILRNQTSLVTIPSHWWFWVQSTRSEEVPRSILQFPRPCPVRVRRPHQQPTTPNRFRRLRNRQPTTPNRYRLAESCHGVPYGIGQKARLHQCASPSTA